MAGSEADDLYQTRLAWSEQAYFNYCYRLGIECFYEVSGPVDIAVEQGVVTDAALVRPGPLT